MDQADGPRNSPLRLILIFLFVIVLPLALGFYAAPRLVPAPKVGIIRLNYDIFDVTAREFVEQMDYAQDDASIKAVVIVMNSPGGSAAFSEEMFLHVLDARRGGLPVLASVDLLAASGAYYTAAAANEVYAKPMSLVGSIGVIWVPPGPTFLDEDTGTTGPYKSFGGTRDAFMRQAERGKFAFLEAVVTGRGERLQVSPSVLSRAEIYTGMQAWEMGLVDGLISNEEVVARAAELAGLSGYETVELYPLAFDDGAGALADYEPPTIDERKLWATTKADLPPGAHHIYIPPRD